jgi:hypothetical protein
MFRIEDLRDDTSEDVPLELPQQNPVMEQFNERIDAWFKPQSGISPIPQGIASDWVPVQQLGLGEEPTIH